MELRRSAAARRVVCPSPEGSTVRDGMPFRTMKFSGEHNTAVVRGFCTADYEGLYIAILVI